MQRKIYSTEIILTYLNPSFYKAKWISEEKKCKGKMKTNIINTGY